MKAKDIKPGEVYAYRRGRYGYTVPVMLLASADADHIYRTQSHRMQGAPAFERTTAVRKPGKSRSGWDFAEYGWAAVTLPKTAVHEHADHDANVYTGDVTTLTGVTLDDFTAATSEVDGVRGIEFTLITNASYLLGPWEETVAGIQATRQAEREEWARQRAQFDAEERRANDLANRLAEYGVTPKVETVVGGKRVTLSLDDVARLVELLGTDRT